MAWTSEYERWVGGLGLCVAVAGCGDSTPATSDTGASTGAESSTGAETSTEDATTGSTTATGSDEASSTEGSGSGDESSSSTSDDPVGDAPADRLFSVIEGRWELEVEKPGCPAYDCPGDEVWGVVGPGYDPISYRVESSDLGTRYKPVEHSFTAVEVDGPLGLGGGTRWWVLRRARTDDLVLVPDQVATPYIGMPYDNYLPLLSHDVLDDGAWQFVFPSLTLRFAPDGSVAGMEDPKAYPRLWFDEAPRISDPTEIFFPDPWDEIFWGDDEDVKADLLEQIVVERPYVVYVCTDRHVQFWPEVAWGFLQYDDPVVRENAVRVLIDLANPNESICTPRLIALDMLGGVLGEDADAGVRLAVAEGVAQLLASGDLWFMPCDLDEALAECAEGDADAGVRAACLAAPVEADAAAVVELGCVQTEQGGEDFGDGLSWTCAISCSAALTCGVEDDADACFDGCRATLEADPHECRLARSSVLECMATVPCEELATTDQCDAESVTMAELCG